MKSEAQPSDEPKAHWASALLAAVCMGLVFGSVMDVGKVTNPIVIRQQFIFQRFIMLKMFLGAAGSSAFFFALLSELSPRRFHVARQGFVDSVAAKGFSATMVGPFILGAGMALAGACPGMVLIQCGGGVSSGPVTLAGGFVAAALFGVVQPYLVGWMGTCNTNKGKAEDIAILSKMPFWVLGLGLSAACFGCVVVFEVLFPWTSRNTHASQWLWVGELPMFANAWTDSAPGGLMGFFVGAMQVPCVLWCLDSLGSSSAYMTFSSQVLVVRSVQDRLSHWNGYRLGVGNWWQAVYLLNAILGAFITSWTTGTFGKAAGVKDWEALVGGFLMIFGSRIASGCTSGHGLSGMGLLILKSMAAVPAMFMGGIMVGFIYQAVDPAGYTGFAYTPAAHLQPL